MSDIPHRLTRTALMCTALAALLSGVALGHDRPGLVPDVDPRGTSMNIPTPAYAAHLSSGQKHYASQPIPKMLIEATEVPTAASEVASRWQEYAHRFGYRYQAVVVGGPEALARVRPRNRDVYLRFLDRGCLRDAKRVLLHEVLADEGGIAVDDKIQPPSLNGQPLDLATLFPLRGGVFLTARRARNVSNDSLYLSESLLAAAPHHPMVERFCETVAENLLSGAFDCADESQHRYITGSTFLSRNLYGLFTLLPYTFAQSLGMLP